MSTSDTSTNLPSPSDSWRKCFSKTHQAHYWFNTANGETSWTRPDDISSSAGTDTGADISKKRPLDPSQTEESTKVGEEVSRLPATPQIAIIVPFRDLHVEQKRQEHLDRFVPAMTEFLRRSGNDFMIYIIEQSSDGRKFNRGKLLNIGFDIARKDGAEIFVFHDVDLLPSDDLLPHYSTCNSQPVHIAHVWDRYNKNEKYFGGIVNFSASQFESINGFPNNFWGWGGEDDEMYKRVKAAGFTPVYPQTGSITDLEDMDLQSKLKFLKSHILWKCMNKNEVLEEHESTWAVNGLSSLRYSVITDTKFPLSDVARKIVVDVEENNHWSDLVCSDSNTQLEKKVDELKREFFSRDSSLTSSTGDNAIKIRGQGSS